MSQQYISKKQGTRKRSKSPLVGVATQTTSRRETENEQEQGRKEEKLERVD